jgi:hypothetical protein
MDYPAPVLSTRTIATVAVFVALVVGSNFALAEIPDSKLDGLVIFVSTMAFGAGTAGAVALLSELIWSQVSPWGPSGSALLPFLLSGELLYVLAGVVAVRLARRSGGGLAERGALFGGLLVVSTLGWDLWTNFGTALMYYGSAVNLSGLLLVEFNPPALLFDIAHEGTNLLLGLLVAPIVSKLMVGRLVRAFPATAGGRKER